MCLNARCRVKFMCADLRFGFLRLSTIKKCPHMLRSDHRELRNSLVQLGWVGGGGGGGWVGGMRANTETSRSSARARAATTMSISYLAQLVNQQRLNFNGPPFTCTLHLFVFRSNNTIT